MVVVQFKGVTVDESAGQGFHLTGLTGWADGAPVRFDAPARPQANGLFRPGTVFRGGRVVSVEGSWSGGSLVDAYAAQRQLASMMWDGLEGPFTVSDPGGSLSVTASLSAAPTMSSDLYAPFFTFAFDVTAADPFRYGNPVPSTTGLATAGSGLVWPLGTGGTWLNWGSVGNLGRVSTPNPGNAQTFSTFTVTGGLGAGFLLTYVPTGAQIQFVRPIPVGSSVTLDPRTGRAVIDGQSDVSGYLTVSDWWPVQPGESGSVQFAALGDVTGSPMLSAQTAPAYI